jgi:FeS assembly SUF system protein
MNQERKIEIEEVSEAPKPPKARVTPPGAAESGGGSSLSQAFERKKDYLAGFLAQKPVEAAPVEPGGNLYEAVIEALKEIYDPEIPVNIYDLGLIYDVEITPEHHAMVKMTLTTPHCPVAESMPGEVELRVGSVPGIGHAEVELVWDPPWDPQKMTDEAKLELGML